MTKIKGYVFLTILVLCTCFIVILIEIQSDYERKLKEKDKIIEEKEKTIESQVRMLIDIKDHCEKCDCEWLQSFYDEFHEEVGAYE